MKAGNNNGVNTQRMYVENPLLWSTEEPNLYKLITQMELIKTDENGNKSIECIECITQNLGFEQLHSIPNRDCF